MPSSTRDIERHHRLEMCRAMLTDAPSSRRCPELANAAPARRRHHHRLLTAPKQRSSAWPQCRAPAATVWSWEGAARPARRPERARQVGRSSAPGLASRKHFPLVLVMLLLSGGEVGHTAQVAITSLVPANGPPTGGFTLTVLGGGLGNPIWCQNNDCGVTPSRSFSIRIGGTACESTTWASDSSMSCKVGSGFFRSVFLVATVVLDSGRVTWSSDGVAANIVRFSFDRPSLKNESSLVPAGCVQPPNGPTLGNMNLTMLGKNLASLDASPRARLGVTACAFTRWISDTSVACRNAPSTLLAQSTIITLQIQKESRLQQFSYDRAEVFSVLLTNSRTAGEGTLTVYGKGFGHADLTQRVRLGLTGCMASRWMSDSAVFCKVPADTHPNLGVTVSVATLQATALGVMSYDVAVITGIHPSNVPLKKSVRVTLVGNNFGGGQLKDRRGRLGDTVCLLMNWISDTSISCMSQPGYSQDLAVTVTIAKTEVERTMLSYDKPQITALLRSNGPASGSAELTIFGKGFGAFELTPLVRIGQTLCMRTQWIAESSVICKAPRITYDKWFTGANVPVRFMMGASINQMDQAYTYDMACVGPCVIGLACRSSNGVWNTGCNGPTHGDYRHPMLKEDRDFRDFNKELVLRIIGNFTLYRTSLSVLVGNTTDNKTVAAMEQIYNDDVAIEFGDEKGMYKCIPLPVPKDPASSTSQQYLDCVMPMGVGHGHRIHVTIRNATYHALEDGCTQEMQKINKDNCLKNSAEAKSHTVADDIGLTFSYNAPVVTSLTPNSGPNSEQGTVTLGGQSKPISGTVTIWGQNFGGEARRLYGSQAKTANGLVFKEGVCRSSNSRSCRLLFQNSVAFFNFSCADTNLMLTSSTGVEMELESNLKTLAYCKEKESFMIKCLLTFDESNRQCTSIAPKFQTVNCVLEPTVCRTFCSEEMLVCQSVPIGGLQKLNVIIGGQTTSGDSATFSYASPVVYEVYPPELAAGASSILTVRGINFGSDIPESYSGRQYAKGPSGDYIKDLAGKKVILQRFDPLIVPFNESSIDWWDSAQYSTCFSAQLEAGKKMAVMDRVCDRGRVLSEQSAIKKGKFNQVVDVDEIIVQAPVVNLQRGETAVSVDVIVQSMGLRSQISLLNTTLSFRASCAVLAPQISALISQWYLALGVTEFAARYGAATISYQNKIWMLGGETKSNPQLDDIYVSSYNGISSYAKIPTTFPWWSPRVNATVVHHEDSMFLMGGKARQGDDSYLCFDDIWVYANDQSVADYYSNANTPVPQLSRGETFQSFWIDITRDSTERRPPARAGAYAVSFKGRVYLIGGQTCPKCQSINQLGKCADSDELKEKLTLTLTDVWSTEDFKTWRLDVPIAPWQGRNNVFAVVHDAAIYVVASVMKQFYNTFYSTDGVNYQMRGNACALTDVDLVSVVSFNSYLMAFTIGCHDQLSFDQTAVKCDHPYAGPLENRIYTTQNGTTWSLTGRPFDVDSFEKVMHQPYRWGTSADGQGKAVDGEVRYDFKVTSHLDTLFIIGGIKLQAPLDRFGKVYKDPDNPKKNYLEVQAMNDIWISKGLMAGSSVCVDKFDDGLSSAETAINMKKTRDQVECKIRWDKNLVRWKSKVQLDQERGYVTRRYLAVYLNRRAIHSNSLEDEYLANATVSTRSTLALINAVSFRACGY